MSSSSSRYIVYMVIHSNMLRVVTTHKMCATVAQLGYGQKELSAMTEHKNRVHGTDTRFGHQNQIQESCTKVGYKDRIQGFGTRIQYKVPAKESGSRIRSRDRIQGFDTRTR